MRTTAPALLPLFRSRLQGDLLARVLLTREARPTISDLARDLQAPIATVQREVQRLEAAGILTTDRVGRARLVQADTTNPVFEPLRQLVMIAFGPRQIVAEEFGDLGAESVAIFGSWAARYSGETGGPPGDVDVLLIGRVNRDDLYDAAERAERRLGRPVNTTVVSRARWAAADESFVTEVQRRPLLMVLPAGAVA
jgi:DNA-binding Lrp family transcriptional regulator